MPLDNNILFKRDFSDYILICLSYRQVWGLLCICMLPKFFNEKQDWMTGGQFDEFLMIITIDVCWLLNVYSAVHVKPRWHSADHSLPMFPIIADHPIYHDCDKTIRSWP